MSAPFRLLIAAGGTGGHLFPALAVAEALRDQIPAEVIFVGTGRELEQKIVGGAGFELRALSLQPVTGRGGLGVLKVLGLFPVRFFQAIRLVRSIRPTVVFGFGGYPSVLPVLAAFLLRIPRVVHEQNAEVGLANRLLGIVATKIFAAPGAQGFWLGADAKVTHLNNPVRKILSNIPDWSPPEADAPLRVLVLGGSQGATSVNTAIVNLLPQLAKRSVSVRHQAGKADAERVRAAYEAFPDLHAVVEPFIDDMAAAYRDAHLIVSRAGAMSAAEIAECGRPAIFVPLPIARSHQRQNVTFLERFEAAVVVEQGEGFDQRLAETLLRLVDSRDTLAHMASQTRLAARQSTARSAEVVADFLRRCGEREL